MSEAPEDPSLPAKRVAFYSALVSAWIQSRMERDRSLITLSSAGIGLLLTLSSTVGPDGFLTFSLYCIGFVGFAVTIISGLSIFHRNSLHIERLIAEKQTTDPLLARLDSISRTGFTLGVLSIVLLGVTAGITRLAERGVF